MDAVYIKLVDRPDIDMLNLGLLPSWWRHQMETFSALLALCEGNSPVTGEFPSQRPVVRSFDVFFDLCPNKRLSKQSWGWWFETPWRSLWCHCNVQSARDWVFLRRLGSKPDQARREQRVSFLIETTPRNTCTMQTKQQIWLNNVSDNEGRYYLCYLISHWLKPCWIKERNLSWLISIFPLSILDTFID